MDDAIEIRTINGWDGYGVSHDGRIWTSKRSPNQWREMKTAVTKPGKKCARGYVQVIFKSNGLKKAFKVHRLVVAAFVGEIGHGYEVNHIDGVKTNNHLSNLEIVTHSQNMNHAKRCGLLRAPKHMRGTLHWAAKLDEQRVKEIREALEDPRKTFVSLAMEYGVSQSLIKQIKQRVIWQHVA